MKRRGIAADAPVAAVIDETSALEHPDRVDELLPRSGYFHGMTDT